MNTEQKEPERTQELSLSDSDIQLILDLAHHAHKVVYEKYAENVYLLNNATRKGVTEKLEEIQNLIDKLNK